MKGSVRFLVILVVISVLISGCAISPMGTKDESIGKTTGDHLVGTSTNDNKNGITINVFVPEQSSLWAKNQQVQKAMPKGVTIHFIETKQKYAFDADEIIPKLLAHSSEFDIFYIQSSQEFARSIVDKGYYVDLLQNEELKTMFDDMYPQIKKWSMHENKVFGFPSIVQPSAHMIVQEYALKQMGYSIDDLRTFSDVFQFSKEWEEKFHETGVYLSLNETVPAILRSYLLSHYDYEKMYVEVDNNEFRDLLQNIKAFTKSQGWVDVDKIGLLNVDFLNTRVFIGNVYPVYVYESQGMSEMEPAPIPLLEQEAPGKRSIDASFYVVNPFSKHINEAMDVMVQIGEISKHIAARDMLYREKASYNSESGESIYGPSIASLYNKKAMYDRMGKFWQQYELYFTFPGMQNILDICNNYIQDEMALDEAIGEMKRTIDIVRRENLQ